MQYLGFIVLVTVIFLQNYVSVIAQAEPYSIVPKTALKLGRLQERTGRQLSDDPIEMLLVHAGDKLLQIKDGNTVPGIDGKPVAWQTVTLNESGGLDQQVSRTEGAYLYIPIESDRERIMILNAAGHVYCYFNGEPRGSDMYGNGIGHFPVKLRKGMNELILRLSWRGRSRVKLYEPTQDVMLLTADKTLPDLVLGEPFDYWTGFVVVNSTEKAVAGLSLTTSGETLTTTTTPIPVIPPMSMRKVGCKIKGPAAVSNPTNRANLNIKLDSGKEGIEGTDIKFELQIKTVDGSIRRTFMSELDDSVQYYGLRQAMPLSDKDPAPAIVLSCHGADVDAVRQSGSYAPKTWLHLVAPTNRRPFGFDWEDFGREDAMEVLGIAKKTLSHDPSRIYLTGHSMGGHGTWHIGATYPDKFAAIGPSAGWVSYTLYRMSKDAEEKISPVEEILRRGNNASDTIGLSSNYKQQGVYVLHGDKDDNVPPEQSRLMAETLKPFHRDWFYKEEPGKGHWWGSDEGDGGAACMDWPEMYDMFARHALPPSHAVREVDFITANPGVSSKCHWLSIEAQKLHHQLSRAKIMTWPASRKFKGTTENVAILKLDTRHIRTEGTITIDLDGQVIENIPKPENDGSLYLAKSDSGWKIITQPPLTHKGPHRYGAVKNELKHHFLFIYATQGTPEANRWAFAKARYDAETYWYRGNASVDVIPDTSFDPAKYPDRSVVIYGNSENNSAWKSLLAESPIQVTNTKIQVSDKTLTGNDLAAVFIRPRKDSNIASVIAISGTGEIGMRTTNPISLFIPFVRYPDLVVLQAKEPGIVRPKVPVAGYFGQDWSYESGEFAWE